MKRTILSVVIAGALSLSATSNAALQDLTYKDRSAMSKAEISMYGFFQTMDSSSLSKDSNMTDLSTLNDDQIEAWNELFNIFAKISMKKTKFGKNSDRDSLLKGLHIHLEKYPEHTEIANTLIYKSMIHQEMFSERWERKVNVNSQTIYQDHDLYNLDRIELTIGNDGDHRMTKGLQAIGHESLPILLCSLLATPNADVYEVTRAKVNQLWAFSLTPDKPGFKYCKDKAEIKKYVSQRKVDFIGPLKHRIIPETTLYGNEDKAYQYHDDNFDPKKVEALDTYSL